jgi:hypothetical protein
VWAILLSLHVLLLSVNISQLGEELGDGSGGDDSVMIRYVYFFELRVGPKNNKEESKNVNVS